MTPDFSLTSQRQLEGKHVERSSPEILRKLEQLKAINILIEMMNDKQPWYDKIDFSKKDNASE